MTAQPKPVIATKSHKNVVVIFDGTLKDIDAAAAAVVVATAAPSTAAANTQ